MKNIAVLMTVYNRKDKTIACLDSLLQTHTKWKDTFALQIFITDDGSTDGTSDAIRERFSSTSLHILAGTGSLYWNGGMINSWQAAREYGNFDGYLWLNDDTIVLADFWQDLNDIDDYSVQNYNKRGIYVGSTCDPLTRQFTYGGFNFVGKWTLNDQFVIPDGKTFQPCQCGHGNITYVSRDVVSQMGIFYDGYIHGAGDHDYTYRAYKRGFPILVMRNYAGMCRNDHEEDGYADFLRMPLKKRIAYLKSPFGFNLHNTILFQKRCFPYRMLFVGAMGYLKALFPSLYFSVYRNLRK